MELVQQIREILPDVSLSSDFICGFCGETDEEFAETLTLIDEVKYNVAFLFPYSMREVIEYKMLYLFHYFTNIPTFLCHYVKHRKQLPTVNFKMMFHIQQKLIV